MYRKPKNRDIDSVFIHCSASDRPEDDDIAVIDEWHRLRGYNGVGYHYFIQRDGMVQFGRSLSKIPAAQEGYNTGSIAICLHGLEERYFSVAQFASLISLCKEINIAHEGAIRFRGHCEVSNKTCPVFKYQKVLRLDEDGKMKLE